MLEKILSKIIETAYAQELIRCVRPGDFADRCVSEWGDCPRDMRGRPLARSIPALKCVSSPPAGSFDSAGAWYGRYAWAKTVF